MRLRGKRIWRWLALLALAVLVAGFVAPYLSMNRFAQRIRQSLEEALGRQVELGEVHLDLFQGPGFSVSRVVIHEDPRISLEPLAYIDSLEARVSFRSLWAGRLAFSNLRLNEPSINLAKMPEGPWNFEPLLGRAVGVAVPRTPRFPNIQVRGGRLNFKTGDVKSLYYVINPEVDITPPSSADGYWQVRFSGEPARTDRPARGFARVTGRGRWRPDPRTGGELELALELEDSPVAELVTLLHGHDVGVHGRISSRARLAGPASAIEITGRSEIRDIHRWDLMPPYGEGWPLDYRGRLDLMSQRLELDTVPPREAAAPLTLRFRAHDYLSRPRWGLLATLNRLSLGPLVEVARHMGVALPQGLSAEGEITGVIGYSPGAGLQGRFSCQGVALTMPDFAGLRLASAEALIDRGEIRLLPAAMRTAGRQQALIEVQYSRLKQALRASVQADSMPIRELQAGVGRLLGPVPVLEHCQEGAWKGRLSYQAGPAQNAQWSGAFEIQDARFEAPGIAVPLEVKYARASLREGSATVDHILGHAGPLEFQGQYRYLEKAARPHQVQLWIPKLAAAELERIFQPALLRREGLLARTLRLGRARVPVWLAERHAEGALEIGSLTLGDLDLRKVRARLRWDAAEAEISDIEGRLADGLLTGRLSVDLSRASPAYRLAARLRSAAWSGGRWDIEGSMETRGDGAELWRNLRGEGAFNGRSVSLGAEAEFDSVSGVFQLTVARGMPRLQLTKLEAAAGEDLYQGQGSTQEDGRLRLDLTAGRKRLRALGTLAPFQLVWERTGPLLQ